MSRCQCLECNPYEPMQPDNCPQCGHSFDFPIEFCVCGLPEGQAQQLMEVAEEMRQRMLRELEKKT